MQWKDASRIMGEENEAHLSSQQAIKSPPTRSEALQAMVPAVLDDDRPAITCLDVDMFEMQWKNKEPELGSHTWMLSLDAGVDMLSVADAERDVLFPAWLFSDERDALPS